MRQGSAANKQIAVVGSGTRDRDPFPVQDFGYETDDDEPLLVGAATAPNQTTFRHPHYHEAGEWILVGNRTIPLGAPFHSNLLMREATGGTIIIGYASNYPQATTSSWHRRDDLHWHPSTLGGAKDASGIFQTDAAKTQFELLVSSWGEEWTEADVSRGVISFLNHWDLAGAATLSDNDLIQGTPPELLSLVLRATASADLQDAVRTASASELRTLLATPRPSVRYAAIEGLAEHGGELINRWLRDHLLVEKNRTIIALVKAVLG